MGKYGRGRRAGQGNDARKAKNYAYSILTKKDQVLNVILL